MSHKSESRYVRAGMDIVFYHNIPRLFIKRCHLLQYVAQSFIVNHSCLCGGRYNARSYGFCQNKLVSRLGACIFQYFIGMYKSRYCQSVFWLVVKYRVSSRYKGSCLVYFIISAFKYGMYMFLFHILRYSHYIKTQLRLSSHGVYIRHGVCRSYLSEQIRVVGNGRKKVHSLHNGNIVAYFINRSIVAFIKSNQKIRVVMNFYILQKLCQCACSDFRPAPCAFCKLRKFNIIHFYPSRKDNMASRTPPPTARALSETV